MRPLFLALVFALPLTGGCTASPTPGNVPASGAKATPVYNDKSGQLEQIVSDSNGDGKVDTRAFMEGRRLLRIEVDRNSDGAADRFEFYGEAPPERVDPTSPAGRAEIERVEESNGPDQRITRREFYERGELARVEDDSNSGRPARSLGVVRQRRPGAHRHGRQRFRLPHSPSRLPPGRQH